MDSRYAGAEQMNPITIILTLLFTLFLTACGGGGSPTSADESASGTDTSNTETEDNSGSSPDSGVDSGTGSSITNISFGSGTEADFQPGVIALSHNYSLVGGTLQLNVNVVNNDAGSAAVAQTYQYEFSSTCSLESIPRASFNVNKLRNSTGQAEVTYRNISCNDSDTITVKLLSADGAEQLAKAIAIVPAYVPQLGYGSGADFIAGKIEGNANLIDEDSTKLTANAVDKENLNSLISSDDYVAQWSASCADASFSIASQPLSTSNIVTRYDANTCTGTDTVTVKLFAKNDLTTVLNSIALNLSIGTSAGVDIDPKLGFGNGSSFNLGQLKLNAEYVLAGGSASLIVNGVNAKDNNSLLKNNYLYKFESSCSDSYFSSKVVASSDGVVTNTYFNDKCDGEDSITVSLFSSGTDVDSSTPLSSANAQLRTALPKIGHESGADFIVDVIDGNTNLVDAASTLLSATVVDPLNVNNVLKSSDYYVKWKSDCDTAEFSIESQNISSAIKTRYDGDANLCPRDTVTLTLFNRSDDALTSITAEISLNESLIPAEPALGRGIAAGFVSDQLEFSETNIAARQTIEVGVNIVDIKDNANTLIKDVEYAVKFDSICVKDGRSSLDNKLVRTTSGIAKVYYTANGCTGSDTINAVLYAVENNNIDDTSSLAVASGSIDIELPEVNSIEYQGMTSRQIALQGTSFTALPEVTEVSFAIKDIYNKPVSGKEVTFSLSNASVDATLSGDLDGDGEVVATTNAEGLVTAYVNSGKTHGLVSVLAVTGKNSGGVLRTQSFGISITTGIPVQPSFSLALDNFNPRGWNVIGEKVAATVQLADRFHNPVPDGTVVNFIADGGSIEPRCETKNGTCFVNWTSGNPRPGFSKDNSPGVLQKSKTQEEHPTNDPASKFYFNTDGNGNSKCGTDDTAPACDPYRLVEIDPSWNGGRSGVVTILAYVEGEVDFADTNGNGRFDEGEAFSSMAEAYLDANEDGKYTAPDENNPFEQIIEYVQDEVMTAAPATYQGGSCTEIAREAGHCDSLVHIRKSSRLIMSSDNVAFKLESIKGAVSGDLVIGECINVYNEKSVTFNFSVNDYNGNIPISGTQLSFEAEGFTIDNQPNPISNKLSIEPTLVPITIRKDAEFSNNAFARLSAAHPVTGESGHITVDNLTDDPIIGISTTDYLLNVSSSKQILEFKFADSCGNPPAASDIIIFSVEDVELASFSKSDVILVDPITNVKTTAATPTARDSKSFQIYGAELTSSGAYRIQIEQQSPASTKDEGELVVKTINSADGLESSKKYSISL